jgi:Lrp/AsnC family transcriptional regulator for asnA, asnC and gidA|tara:strand:- start:773 stop:1291 length:519 start_codon:yes stop_codon:yes gene_type:complete
MNIFIIKCLRFGLLQLKILIFNSPQILVIKIINHDLVLDGIDKQILDHLVENARKPILEIARNIGASGASVHQRVRKMEEVGIISGSYIKINQEKLGYTTQDFVGIFLDKATHHTDAVAMLEEIPEVTSCYYTTGDWSLLIKLNCKGNNHLSSLLSGKIQNITGVLRTETYI